MKSGRESHPKEMYLLAVIEMCQRFAFWGIGNLLVLYLVQSLRFADAKADSLYGLYSGVALMLPLIGGWVADRTSHSRAVICGSLLTALGAVLLAIGHHHLIYIALAAAAFGAGLFTPSIYTILGRIYHEKYSLREGGFSIYYAAVNLGVFLATISMGALGNAGKWVAAYLLAAAVQLLGLVLFLMIKKKIEHLFHAKSFADKEPIQGMKKREFRRVILIAILSVVSILFWMSYNQGWSSMSLFILKFTKREIAGITFAPSWLLSTESLFLVLLAYPLASFYRFLGRHRKDPNPIIKTSYALLFMTVCFLIMAFGARMIPASAKIASVSFFYPLAAYFFMALAEMFLAPIGLSLVTHLSPKKYTAFLVGVWYVCIGVAYYLGGSIAGLMETFSSLGRFFDLFAMICGCVCIALFVSSPWLNKMRCLEGSKSEK